MRPQTLIGGVVLSDLEADKIERFAPLVACAHVGSFELIPNTAWQGDVITVIARINMGAINFAWGWRRRARPDFDEVSSRDDENDDSENARNRIDRTSRAHEHSSKHQESGNDFSNFKSISLPTSRYDQERLGAITNISASSGSHPQFKPHRGNRSLTRTRLP